MITAMDATRAKACQNQEALLMVVEGDTCGPSRGICLVGLGFRFIMANDTLCGSDALFVAVGDDTCGPSKGICLVGLGFRFIMAINTL